MGKRKNPRPPDGDREVDAVDGETAITEEDIDQTLKESFPASDPSPWTLGSTRTQNPETVSPQPMTPDESGVTPDSP